MADIILNNEGFLQYDSIADELFFPWHNVPKHEDSSDTPQAGKHRGSLNISISQILLLVITKAWGMLMLDPLFCLTRLFV